MIEIVEVGLKILAAMGLGGFGLAWLNRRKTNAETDKLVAEVGEVEADTELKHTQAKHIRFGELEATVRILSERMNIAERELKDCKSRETRQARRMSEIEVQQKSIVAMLRSTWPVDHSIPPDMMALLDKIEARHGAAARRKKKPE